MTHYHTTYGEPEKLGFWWCTGMIALFCVGVVFLWVTVPILEASERRALGVGGVTIATRQWQTLTDWTEL